MALNLQAVRIFAAVAKTGGFSKAATFLRLSQPAVSKAVLILERQLGMPLFERGARSVQLTDAGRALYGRAQELFAVERSAEEELEAQRNLEFGVLRIGASTTIATYLLPRILGVFRSQHPGIRLRVTSANTRDVARALRQRRLDVALVEGPVSMPRVQVVYWRDDELIIIAPPSHALGIAKAPISFQDLALAAFIWRERGSGTREVAEAAFRENGITPRISLVLGNTEAVKQAVAAGMGFAVMSRAAAADQLALGTVKEVAIANFRINRQLTRLNLEGRALNPAAVEFNKLLDIVELNIA